MGHTDHTYKNPNRGEKTFELRQLVDKFMKEFAIELA